MLSLQYKLLTNKKIKMLLNIIVKQEIIDKKIFKSNKQIWCRKDIVERNVTRKSRRKTEKCENLLAIQLPLLLPLQDVCCPSHFEELRQVLFSEPCISYPSSHVNQQVSFVTNPLQVM